MESTTADKHEEEDYGADEFEDMENSMDYGDDFEVNTDMANDGEKANDGGTETAEQSNDNYEGDDFEAEEAAQTGALPGNEYHDDDFEESSLNAISSQLDDPKQDHVVTNDPEEHKAKPGDSSASAPSGVDASQKSEAAPVVVDVQADEAWDKPVVGETQEVGQVPPLPAEPYQHSEVILKPSNNPGTTSPKPARRGSVMMSIPVYRVHNAKVNFGHIVPGFDPALGEEPTDPHVLLACKRQGVLPKELLLKDFEEFRGIRGEVPVHIAKIRFKHHKDLLEDLLTLVKDDMGAHKRADELEINGRAANGVTSSDLPDFLRQDELALSLTQEDLAALAHSFDALRKDEEDLRGQMLHSIKLERKERDRTGNIEARRQEIAKRQKEIFDSYCNELMSRKRRMAEKNKVQWLQVQRTFLGNWLGQDNQIKMKEIKLKERQDFENFRRKKNLEETERKRLIAEDKHYVTERMRRIRNHRAEHRRKKTKQRNEELSRRMEVRQKVIERKRFAAEQAQILRGKVEESRRVANIRNNWTELETLYEELGAPPASATTILVEDFARTYAEQVQMRRSPKSSLDVKKPKKPKKVYKERFQCPIPKDSQHAIDMYTVMKEGNFEIIEKKIRSADIVPLMCNPKALRKTLLRLHIEPEEAPVKAGSRSPRGNSSRPNSSKNSVASSSASSMMPRPPSRSSSVGSRVRPKSQNQQNRIANSRSTASTPQDYYDGTGSSIPSRPSTSMDFNSRPSTTTGSYRDVDPSLSSMQETLGGRKTIRSAGRHRNKKRPRQRPRHEHGKRRNVYSGGRPSSSTNMSGSEKAKLRLQERYRRFTQSPIGKKRRGYET